jgi:hypothetical protein
VGCCASTLARASACLTRVFVRPRDVRRRLATLSPNIHRFATCAMRDEPIADMSSGDVPPSARTVTILRS